MWTWKKFKPIDMLIGYACSVSILLAQVDKYTFWVGYNDDKDVIIDINLIAHNKLTW